MADQVFEGSVAQLYDDYLVPLLFAPYARDMAGRLGRLAPATVLEIAAGTGAVTREILKRLPDVRLTATDLNPPMLDRAMARAPRGAVAWQQADAQALPFADGGFDAVVCQFGAMFFPDKVQAYREARRILAPGGAYLLSVWDRISENVFSDIAVAALAEFFPADPPRFLARTPHGHHDTARLEADLRAAGFRDVQIEAVSFPSKAESARTAAIALCQGTPMRGEIEARGSLAEATAHVERAVARRFGTGPITGAMRAFVVAAR